MRVAAICMQKNESSLIETWVLHHANLFGAENVFVLDNQSDDLETCRVLKWAESCGVNVLYDFENFEFKGREVRSLINKHRAEYDWFVPLDADEFLGVFRNGSFAMRRSVVLSEFEMMRRDKIIRMSKYVWCIPRSPLGYFTEARKVIIPQPVDVPLDIGFHLYSWDEGSTGNTVADDLFQQSHLAYAHFHNKPYHKVIASAKLKLAARVPSFSAEDLNKYTGAGRHLIQYFNKTEDEYNKSFPSGTVNLTKAFFEAGLVAPFSTDN